VLNIDDSAALIEDNQGHQTGSSYFSRYHRKETESTGLQERTLELDTIFSNAPWHHAYQ